MRTGEGDIRLYKGYVYSRHMMLINTNNAISYTSRRKKTWTSKAEMQQGPAYVSTYLSILLSLSSQQSIEPSTTELKQANARTERPS